MYRSEDAAEKFVRDLKQEAISCHICTQPLGDDKVRDHCHIVGSYRGEAHSECNLMYRTSKSGWKLPVLIHNLKGYDGLFDCGSIEIYRLFPILS